MKFQMFVYIYGMNLKAIEKKTGLTLWAICGQDRVKYNLLKDLAAGTIKKGHTEERAVQTLYDCLEKKGAELILQGKGLISLDWYVFAEDLKESKD